MIKEKYIITGMTCSACSSRVQRAAESIDGMELAQVNLLTGTMLAEYDESKTIDDEIEIPVQVNGKLKTTVMIALDEDEASVKEKVHSALEDKLDGKSIVKEIYVKNKIYNIVVK